VAYGPSGLRRGVVAGPEPSPDFFLGAPTRAAGFCSDRFWAVLPRFTRLRALFRGDPW